MNEDQWVCVVCGYNMIGEMPDVCPFCGARHDKFVTWQQAERTYRVTPSCVTDRVTQLLSVPRLGIEHAAYRLETEAGAVWIDCPSAFNRDLAPVQAIYFTHKDFLGASNQYRALWGARVCLNAADAEHPLAKPFPIDWAFEGGFVEGDVRAVHIGGHTPGFTMYVFDGVLFACDYAYPPGEGMHLNPYGPKAETRAGAERVLKLMDAHAGKIETVCGYNYSAGFADWRRDFERAFEAA